MPAEWDTLSEELQLTIASAALARASSTVADQAESLAREIDCGAIPDRGGADTLRLFATLLRVHGRTPSHMCGQA